MSITTSDTPQVLLEHHLKTLRLPTILREYDKLARQCAIEKPVAFGGHQEREQAAGHKPGAVAFGAAAELAGRNLAADAERLAGLRDRFENAVLGRISGAGVDGTPDASNLYFDGLDGEALVVAAGFCAASPFPPARPPRAAPSEAPV